MTAPFCLLLEYYFQQVKSCNKAYAGMSSPLLTSFTNSSTSFQSSALEFTALLRPFSGATPLRRLSGTDCCANSTARCSRGSRTYLLRLASTTFPPRIHWASHHLRRRTVATAMTSRSRSWPVTSAFCLKMSDGSFFQCKFCTSDVTGIRGGPIPMSV